MRRQFIFELLIASLLVILGPKLHGSELDYSHHHSSGAAVIRRGQVATVASYWYEDSDLGHAPEAGKSTFIRIVLTPLAPVAMAPDAALLDGEDSPVAKLFDQSCEVNAHSDARGHVIMRWCGWEVELVPGAQRDSRQTARTTGTSSAWSAACFGEIAGGFGCGGHLR